LIHSRDVAEAPGALLARRFLPEAKRYLLAFDRGGGVYDFRYERPHYAWADTIIRPVLAQPDGVALAEAPKSQWTSESLPGMTGVCATLRPVSDRPDVMARRLAELDPC
jgi:hypothetical protein